jgi:hypothetical protein
MTRTTSLVVCLALLWVARLGGGQAFVTPRPSTTTRRATTTTMHAALPSSLVLLESTTNWLATVDSDIANIGNDEFRTVFLGGCLVMLGGLASAVAVGTILEASDGYAAVVAESYDDLEDRDGAFWQNLSDEEKVKAQEILAKITAAKAKQQGSGGTSTVTESPPSLTTTTTVADEATAVTTTSSSSSPPPESRKEVDMFSDY